MRVGDEVEILGNHNKGHRGTTGIVRSCSVNSALVQIDDPETAVAYLWWHVDDLKVITKRWWQRRKR